MNTEGGHVVVLMRQSPRDAGAYQVGTGGMAVLSAEIAENHRNSASDLAVFLAYPTF
jgi:hypothetical protein